MQETTVPEVSNREELGDRLQDIVGAPSPPEKAYVLPRRLCPDWAASAIIALWEPGIGEPTVWLLQIQFRDERDEDIAILSGCFLAPDAYCAEILRLGDSDRWPSLGAWLIGMHLRAVANASVPSFRTRAGGEVRAYEFVTATRSTFGLLDMMAADGQERALETTVLEAAMIAFFRTAMGSSEAAVAEHERLSRDLLPDDGFVLRMQA